MQMNRTILAAALCAAALSIPACDDADTVERVDIDGLAIASPEGLAPDADAVDFREPGPPSALYVTEWDGGKIRRAGFKQIIDNCWKHGDPVLTCTLSWYDPDTSTAGTQVVGIGCSMVASQGFLDCHKALFLQNGGKPL